MNSVINIIGSNNQRAATVDCQVFYFKLPGFTKTGQTIRKLWSFLAGSSIKFSTAFETPLQYGSKLSVNMAIFIAVQKQHEPKYRAHSSHLAARFFN